MTDLRVGDIVDVIDWADDCDLPTGVHRVTGLYPTGGAFVAAAEHLRTGVEVALRATDRIRMIEETDEGR
jgi:hypothetical protein